MLERFTTLMARTIRLQVITNEGQALIDEAVSVRAPGTIGYLGMLYNHAPLVTTLQPGTLSWRRADGATHSVRIGPGLLEIAANALTILTDAVTLPEPASAR